MTKQGFLILIITVIALSCKTTTKLTPTQSNTNPQYIFPIDWIGHYKGDLNILGAQNDTISVIMELIIDHPDAMGLYPWVLKYDEKDVRYYGLEVVDATKGHYRIDEHNGIKLDAYLRSNHLITDFEVVGNHLNFHYEKKTDGIAIQVYSSRASSYTTTGDEIIGKDTIPPVKSFPVTGYQSGYLYKIK